MEFSDKVIYIDGKKNYVYFSDHRTGLSNEKTRFSTTADEREWRFYFECEEEFFSPKHTRYNDPLYDGDIVELMITLGDKNRYLEVEVNQNNANYCVLIDNLDGQGNIRIEFLRENPVKSLVKVEKNRWSCDIIIPFERLNRLGFNVDNAYMNAFRQDYDAENKLSLYSLSPAKSDTFHKIDAFLKVETGKGSSISEE